MVGRLLGDVVDTQLTRRHDLVTLHMTLTTNGLRTLNPHTHLCQIPWVLEPEGKVWFDVNIPRSLSGCSNLEYRPTHGLAALTPQMIEQILELDLLITRDVANPNNIY